MKKIFIAILFISSNIFASGELHISSESISPRIVPQEGIQIPMLQLNLSTKNEPVSIEKLIFKRTGLSSSQDIKSIRATGSNIRSRNFPILTNDTATIRFFKELILPANTVQPMTIEANLDVQGLGRTVGLELVEIVSSAEKMILNNAQETSARETVSKTSSIEKKLVEIEKLKFTPSRLRLERWQKLGRFRLKNTDTKSVNLDSLYLQHNGTGALGSIFHNIILTSKNSVVSYSTKISDRSAHISFLNDININENSDRLIDVWGKVKRNKSTYSVDFSAENDDVVIK